MADNPVIDASSFYDNICERLDDVLMPHVLEEARLAWIYAQTMAARFGDWWLTLEIDLGGVKEDVTQGLIDKMNLVRITAPGWGAVVGYWRTGHCSRHEDELGFWDNSLCYPGVDGFTLEDVHARFHDCA